MNSFGFDEEVLRNLDKIAKRNTDRFLINNALATLPDGTALERALAGIAERAPFDRQLINLLRPYLLRTYLLPDRLKIGSGRPYLHYFFRGDDDRAYHNHPWESSHSLILTGGYEETRLVWTRLEDGTSVCSTETRIFKPWSTNRIDRDTYHKVRLLEPDRGCWTLFWSHNRLAESSGYDWGFLDEDGTYECWGAHHKRIHGEWPVPDKEQT